MKRYLLSGGTPYKMEFDHPIETIYGFESLRFFFRPGQWQGGYVSLSMVLDRPEKYLAGVNLWWISLNFSDRDIADKLARAFDFARSQGTIIMGEPNGGYHANLFMTPPFVIDLWKHGCSAIVATSPDPDMVRAYEKVYGKPAFGCPPPVDLPMHTREIAKAAGPLPENIGEYFLLGTVPTQGNLITLQAAELMGIPLLITCPPDIVAGWKDCVEKDRGGFKYIQWLPMPEHYNWLWYLKNSRGIFNLNHHPSTGRYTLYAGLMGKISLSNNSAWQEILFPGQIMPPDAAGCINWQEYEQECLVELPLIPGRLAEYSPEKCQGKLERFLEGNFPCVC
jgi:hypothetical protein